MCSAAEKMSKSPGNGPRQDDLERESFPQFRDWQEVFDSVRPGLRNFLISKLPQPADADDCLQAVSLAMLQNKTEIPPAARRAWLFRVASNEAALWWRKKMANDRVLEKQASYTTSDQSDPTSQDIEKKEAAGQALDAIGNLPESSQVIVTMRIQQNKTFQMIADELQLPLGTVLTRMRRAMEKLRQELDDGR